MSNVILAIAEQTDGQFRKVTYEALSEGKKIASANSFELVAVVLGGGLILSGIMGLSALNQSLVVNPPLLKKIELWSSILLGVLLILMGAAGSALLLGIILGVALISNGLQQWRMADNTGH